MKQFRIPSVARKIEAMRFVDDLEYRMKPPFWNDTFFARLPNQRFFVTDKSGEVAVCCIVRFEKLNEAFPAVCREFGLKDVVLPQVNKTTSKSDKTPYQDYYQETGALDLVRELYADDFENFDYPKHL